MPDKSTQDEVMPVQRMKHFFALAESEKVPCAFGVGKDRKEAFLLIDKNSTPKKISALLKKDLRKVLDPTSLRFGRVGIDADEEPGTVSFTIHKAEAAGTKNLMTKLVKTAGRQVAVFEIDAELDKEEDEDGAQGGEAEDEDEERAQGGEADDDSETDEDGEDESEDRAPEAPPLDHATLAHTLAQLIPAIPKLAAGNAELQKALTQRAAAAGAALKGNDLATAAAAIEQLRKALAAVGHARQQQGTAPPQSARIPAADLLARFVSAKEDVDTGLSRLQAALRGTGDEELIRIADLGMYGMTDGEGVGLMKALLELRGATPDRQEALAMAAREAALAYKAAVFRHVLVDLVDDNPWGVDVGIQARLGPALDAIAQAA